MAERYHNFLSQNSTLVLPLLSHLDSLTMPRSNRWSCSPTILPSRNSINSAIFALFRPPAGIDPKGIASVPSHSTSSATQSLPAISCIILYFCRALLDGPDAAAHILQVLGWFAHFRLY